MRTLLDLSKLDAGAMTPDLRAFPIDDLIGSLVKEQARGAAQRGLKLRHFATGRWVLSDPLLLRRVVQNLIANGLRYTRRGGVLIGGRARAGRWSVEVWDTGPGIPEERRDAIFQEFQRGEAGEHGGQGFGLGLAIVRRLALALEHPIGLRSRVGGGSMFSVSLPIAEKPKAERAQPRAEPSLVARGPLSDARVLVIENDAAVLTAMSALLSRWGCEVAIAPSGDEAAEIALRRGPAGDHRRPASRSFRARRDRGDEGAARGRRRHPRHARHRRPFRHRRPRSGGSGDDAAQKAGPAGRAALAPVLPPVAARPIAGARSAARTRDGADRAGVASARARR